MVTPSIANRLGAGQTAVGIRASGFGVGVGLAYPLRHPFRLFRTGCSGLPVLATGMTTLATASTPLTRVMTLLVWGRG